jgi:hypothetical protein
MGYPLPLHPGDEMNPLRLQLLGKKYADEGFTLDQMLDVIGYWDNPKPEEIELLKIGFSGRLKFSHEDGDKKGDAPGSMCEGNMKPAMSIDSHYDRFECEKCHVGISIKKVIL